MLRRFLFVVGATLLLIATPSQAHAQRSLTIGFSGGADPYVATGDLSTDSPWIERADAVGAQMIRLDVNWASVAPRTPPTGFRASDPASPGYDWTSVDAAVRELASSGFTILIDIWGAPIWAEGVDMPANAPAGSWRPSATAFGAFGAAIATRYSGSFQDSLNPGSDLPRVSDWQGWNEPNLDTYLTPQWVHTSTGLDPESPVLYRSLQNAFYASVKRVDPSSYVVQAGTAPYGDPPGGERMPPVAFDRALFCLNVELQRLSCPDPVHLDAIDHHAYGIYGPTWHALNADDVAVPDIYKLVKVLHAAERAHTVLPRGPKQVWDTEISWDTNPPNPQAISTATVAHWLEQSFYVLWSQGVDTILWWQLADSPPIPNYLTAYEAGVYFLNGAPKPGAIAFRFPFVTNRIDARHVEAWGRAPVSGEASIEMLAHDRWRTVDRLSVGADRVFEAPIALRGHASLRVQLAGQTTLVWDQSS
ncbi:MAG: hypothetical protein ACLP8S_00720 [Solirubrobacteraceae bacterium]